MARARNSVIGRDNRIPWHLPDELKLFKRLTLGHTLVLGRRTHESIGRVLPGRTSIIVSSQPDYVVPGGIVAHSLPHALQLAGNADTCVIGGVRLFAEALPRATHLHLTEVDAAPEGDTFMPAIDFAEWRAVRTETHPADDRHAHAFVYTEYVRER